MSDKNAPAFEALVGDPRIVDLKISDARDIAAICAGATRTFLGQRAEEAARKVHDNPDMDSEGRPLVESILQRLYSAQQLAGDTFLIQDVIHVLIYARDLK